MHRGGDDGGPGNQRHADDLVDPRQAGRRDRRPERRAHRRIGLPDGARQHVAHGQHAGGDRAGRCAAAGARGGAHAAIGHVADAPPAAPDERTQRRTRPAGSSAANARALQRRADAQFLGVQAARRRQRRSAARSSVSTMPTGSGRRNAQRCRSASSASRHSTSSTASKRRTPRRSRAWRSSDIEQQVLYHAKRKTGGFDPLATLRLQHARPTDLAAGEVTLFDVLEQARAMRRLLGVARGADPEDLNPPERTGQGTIDLVELDARVVRAENALNAAHKGLQNLIARITTTTTAEMLRTALLKLGAFGIEPSVPVSVAGEDADAKAALVQQGQALLKLSGPRLDQGAALRTEPVGRRSARPSRAAGGADARGVRRSVRRAAAVHVRCRGRDRVRRARSAASTAAQGGDPLAVNTWFARCSRVRDGVSRFGACLQRAEVLGAGARLNLSVAQLPFKSGERWVGAAAGGRRTSFRRASCRSWCTPSARSTPRCSRPACWSTSGSRSCRTRARPPRWHFSSTCRTRARRRACSSPCRRCPDRTGPPRPCAAC